MSRYYLDRIPHSVVFATSLNDLYNNHTINFDGVNIGAGQTRHTSLDWFLAPVERPSIDEASVKEHYIDVPGANGGLDLTESLTGFPLYNYIEGEFEFNVLNERTIANLNSIGEKVDERYVSWETLNRDIRTFLNGRERYMMFEDDPSWYYKGRFTVGKYDSSEASNSKITIKYKVYPFKKLSSYIYNPSPLNTFFDTVSLTKDDVSTLVSTFRNKTNINMYLGDAELFMGDEEGQLPCGDEPVAVTFIFDSPIAGYKAYMMFTGSEGNRNREITLNQGVQSTSVRGVVLTNKYNSGVLYSDYRLMVVISLDDYDPEASYKKDDLVSYTSAGDVEWFLKAKQDITGTEGATGIDVTKWDVVTDAITINEYNESNTYSEDDVVYRIDTTQNDIIVYKALYSDVTGTFDPSKWEVITPKTSEFYKPVKMTMRYDIGVM